MPDIGLLQGPPRKPQLTLVEKASVSSAPEARALIPMAEEGEAIRVAARTAVVSDAPIAVLVDDEPEAAASAELDVEPVAAAAVVAVADEVPMASPQASVQASSSPGPAFAAETVVVPQAVAPPADFAASSPSDATMAAPVSLASSVSVPR